MTKEELMTFGLECHEYKDGCYKITADPNRHGYSRSILYSPLDVVFEKTMNASYIGYIDEGLFHGFYFVRKPDGSYTLYDRKHSEVKFATNVRDVTLFGNGYCLVATKDLKYTLYNLHDNKWKNVKHATNCYYIAHPLRILEKDLTLYAVSKPTNSTNEYLHTIYDINHNIIDCFESYDFRVFSDNVSESGYQITTFVPYPKK